MVDFHHFHVIGVAEQGGETGKQIHDDVDADAHVCGAEDETVSGEVVEFGELLFGKARGADDDGIAAGRSGACGDHAGLGRGEIDDDGPGTGGQNRGDVAGNQDAGSFEGVESVQGFRAFEHGGKDKIVRFLSKPCDGGSHATGRAHDDDGKSHMISPGMVGMILKVQR